MYNVQLNHNSYSTKGSQFITVNQLRPIPVVLQISHTVMFRSLHPLLQSSSVHNVKEGTGREDERSHESPIEISLFLSSPVILVV
jgi:hypothetical protein